MFLLKVLLEISISLLANILFHHQVRPPLISDALIFATIVPLMAKFAADGDIWSLPASFSFGYPQVWRELARPSHEVKRELGKKSTVALRLAAEADDDERSALYSDWTPAIYSAAQQAPSEDQWRDEVEHSGIRLIVSY